MSMRILATVLFLATIVLQTGAAFAADKNKAPITDDSIRDQVMMRLAGDSDVKGGGINVDVKDGAVTLTGIVDTGKARQKAEKLTKHVKGVKAVTNQLTIRQ
jgi:hyperosmotically inducible periplasmic protein